MMCTLLASAPFYDLPITIILEEESNLPNGIYGEWTITEAIREGVFHINRQTPIQEVWKSFHYWIATQLSRIGPVVPPTVEWTLQKVMFKGGEVTNLVDPITELQSFKSNDRIIFTVGQKYDAHGDKQCTIF